MKNQFSKKKLKKMIKSNFTDLSSDDIKKLIETEVAKGAENADTDYIDLCFELLAVNNNNHSPVTHKVKVTKALPIAAIIAVLMVTAITASAYVFDFNIPEAIARLINNNAVVDMNLDNADTSADGYALLDTELAQELKEHGISPVTIPADLVKDSYKITQIEYPNTNPEFSVVAIINFEHNGQSGHIRITQSVQDFESAGYEVKQNVHSGQIIKVNGMDILVFERDESCTIRYKDNLTDYNLYIESDINTALTLAKSIK